MLLTVAEVISFIVMGLLVLVIVVVIIAGIVGTCIVIDDFHRGRRLKKTPALPSLGSRDEIEWLLFGDQADYAAIEKMEREIYPEPLPGMNWSKYGFFPTPAQRATPMPYIPLHNAAAQRRLVKLSAASYPLGSEKRLVDAMERIWV